MKTAVFFIIVCFSIFLTACDPAKILVFQTSGKPGTSITVYTNTSIVPFTTGKEKMILHLPEQKSQHPNDTTFFYGIGTWSKESILALSENIDSIIITNSKNKIVLNNTKAIADYFQNHRKGFAGSFIRIEAK